MAISSRLFGESNALPVDRADARPRGFDIARLLPRRQKFEDQVRAEIPTLYRVARRLAPGQIEEAEDAVGQTLLKAFRSQDQFNGQHLRSWLITILRNEMHNRRRYLSVRPAEVEMEVEQSIDSHWSEVSRMLDHEAILAALDNLDEDFRMAIQLCDIEGMSYDEASLALDVPIGTIRSRLFRARAKLRNCLAKNMGVSEELS